MRDVEIYYVKDYQLSDEHKKHISEGMKRMYASKGGKRTSEERKNISDGMKRVWKEWKRYWAEGEC